jgi:hypothetical protein
MAEKFCWGGIDDDLDGYTDFADTADCGNFPTVTCNSCDDCSNKADNASQGTTIQLTRNIQDTVDNGNCVDLGAIDVGIIFDCQGYIIDGTNKHDSGISIGSGTMNDGYQTIKNCKITRFGYGIYAYVLENGYFENVEAYGNASGIRLQNSDNNSGTIINSHDNDGYGFYVLNSEDNIYTSSAANGNGNRDLYLNCCRNSVTGPLP